MSKKFMGLFLIVFLLSVGLVSAVTITNVNVAVDDHYALLEFETSESTLAKIEYSNDIDMSSSQEITPEQITTTHKILIPGLEENETYYYKIEVFTSDGTKTYDCSSTSYTEKRCNIPGPNFGECFCRGSGDNPDCGTTDYGRYCANGVCRQELPDGYSADFSKCNPRNFTTTLEDELDPFLWEEIPEGVGQTSFSLEFTTEPYSKVNVSLNGELIKILNSKDSGKIASLIQVDESIPDNTLKIKIQDRAGKIIEKDFTFVVMLYPPELTQSSEIPSVVGFNHFNFSGEINEEAYLKYIVEQGDEKKEEEIRIGPGDFKVTIPLFEGNNAVYLEYYNRAGLGQKITRTSGNPRLYTQNIISDTKPPILKEDNLGDLTPTTVRFLAARGIVEDTTKTTVSVKTKIIDSVFFSFRDLDEGQDYDSRQEGELVNLGSKSLSSGENNFDINFMLPIEVNARVIASLGEDGYTADGEFKTSVDMEVYIIVEDEVGHKTNITRTISFNSGCGSNNDYIVQFQNPYPDRLDPYLVQNGLAEIYIPFTIEYVGTGGFPQISSESYTEQKGLGAFNKEQFDWDALGTCDVEIVGEEGTIICPIKPYTPKDHESTGIIDPATGLEEIWEGFDFLKIPTMLKFSYTFVDYDQTTKTNTFQECGEVLIQIDTNMLDNEVVQDLIENAIPIVETLKNATKVVEEGLGWATQIGIGTYFVSTIPKVINKMEEMNACGGLSVGIDGADESWGTGGTFIDGVKKVGNILLAKPSAYDRFNFLKGASDKYCEDVYKTDGDEKNPMQESCEACQTAMLKSNSYDKTAVNSIGDRLFCPSVPTYQEFVRQRFLELRKAQMDARVIDGDNTDVLKVSNEFTGTNPEQYVINKVDKKDYKKTPLDFECENAIVHVINNNDELEKLNLFDDVKNDFELDKSKKPWSDDSCVKAYLEEYNSACLGGAIGNRLYTQSRDYQIQVAKEVKAQEEVSTQGIFDSLGYLFDKTSSLTQLCNSEDVNNSHYKEIIDSDKTFFSKASHLNVNFDTILEETKNNEKSYGFLIQGSKVYFIQAQSSATVEQTSDRTFKVGSTDLEFELDENKRIYVNRYGCAFSQRLPKTSDLPEKDVDSNPHYFYPTEDWSKCIAPNNDNLIYNSLIGPIPKRVFNDIIFEGGKTTLYKPTSNIISGIECLCLPSVRKSVQTWNRMLVAITDCLEAARSGGPIEDYACYEMFSEQLCDAIYTGANCFLENGASQGFQASIPSDYKRDDAKNLEEGFNSNANFFTAVESIGDSGEERYGASYEGMLEMSSKGLVYSACYSFLGLEIPADMNIFAGTGLADSLTDSIITEPLASFSRTRGVYSGADRTSGYPRIMYQIAPLIMSNADNTQVRMELVCSNTYDCNNFAGGNCDCVGYPTEQVHPLNTIVLNQNEDYSELLTPVINNRPYRFDKVRMIVSYRDASGQMVQLPPVVRELNFGQSQESSDCSYSSDYIDRTTGVPTGGYVCRKYNDAPSEVIISPLKAIDDTVFALKSPNGQPSNKNGIGLEEFTVTVDDGLYETQNPGNMEQYEYNPVAESQSDQAGYQNPRNARYWSFVIRNEDTNSGLDNVILKTVPENLIRDGLTASQMLLPGENKFGPGELNDLSNKYEVDFARLTNQNVDTTGTVEVRPIIGDGKYYRTKRIVDSINVDDYYALLSVNSSYISFATSRDFATSAEQQNSIEPKNYKSNFETNRQTNDNSITLQNVEFIFNDLADDTTEYYLVKIDKNTIQEGVQTTPEICENGATYTLEFNIHGTRNDGTPDPQILSTKKVLVDVRCYESEDASASTSSDNIIGKDDCEQAKGVCFSDFTNVNPNGVTSVTCGTGIYSSIGLCTQSDACCTINENSCKNEGGVLVDYGNCKLGGQLGHEVENKICCRSDMVNVQPEDAVEEDLASMD